MEYAEMKRKENVEGHRSRREHFLVREAEQGVNTASRKSRRLLRTPSPIQGLTPAKQLS